jgi:hypothetical protein
MGRTGFAESDDVDIDLSNVEVVDGHLRPAGGAMQNDGTDQMKDRELYGETIARAARIIMDHKPKTALEGLNLIRGDSEASRILKLDLLTVLSSISLEDALLALVYAESEADKPVKK